ncbi:bifunctional biotin--[acetyl-CoA-carboxylase] ligase/biotin operon repressor BirA [Pseudomonas sp. LS44]|uniref:bifunctional biotin--[acetyl-CoA-carboxylase] ligase/biotin operon repressor BirA n=1 Tax=Pseudomonas sp. LS44 TaxID=1357074 RepID=UPI00215AA7C2|nr:bifunctional biotin--[acetyl-CoA-carboxylase] ligase/biotin operon repressor BirA [Pseudomonas sp. LS44]UVE17361.1 bifunctional biotin--[acetyl-CoA-carboxylase] ligase/biotin operon repressor BirA [Pseudomonas sp. LS44]
MSTLLKLLQDGRFHSGEALGAQLGISRSAVWKQLQQLEINLRIRIHKVRGRGYRLADPLVLLDADQLSRQANAEFWPFILLDSVDSTNAEALRYVGRGMDAPFAVLAERQVSGRGRRGRSWASPYAENIYYSLALQVEGGARQLEGLSLVVGLAVMWALRDVGVPQVGLKWPNDLLVSGRKIAGILLELSGDPADICHVVMGIGVNVNMGVSVDEIGQPWTSIRLESGQVCDRNNFVICLSRRLAEYLKRHSNSGFPSLRSEWEANHLWQGRNVLLEAGAQRIEGRILGVDQCGALRLEVEGREHSFSGGELSLRLRDDS